MASSRRSQDQQPLLQGDQEPDNRFAIDDDLAELRQTEEAASPKYPPLPPSYDDTLKIDAQSHLSRWNPARWFTLSRTTREHIQACLPRTSSGNLLTWSTAASGCYVGVTRCWPTNRFAQASIFIIGLWLIVLFTGPSFYQAPGSNAGNGLHQDWDYSNVPSGKPAPLHEDGHVVEEAQWHWKGCASIKGTSRVQCTETSSILLNPSKAKDSFASTESIFVDVDPLRSDRPDPAGSVPGTITVVHQPPFSATPQDEKDLVKVEITAKYDEAYKFLFERSLVAKMNRGVFDEGLEILTYAKAVLAEESPLVFNIRVVIPASLNIPTLSIDSGASDIELFSQAGQKRQAATMTTPDFYFGKLHARTQVGSLRSESIKALSDIHLTTTTGGLHVAGTYQAKTIELKTVNGPIDIDADSDLQAAYDLTLQTQNGPINIGRDTHIRATTLRSESLNGGIFGRDAVFGANHTLVLRTSTGIIQAGVSVERPDLKRLDAPGLGHSGLVTVEAASQTGSVEIDFVRHEPQVGLRCRASSEISKVSMAMHEEFEGRWEVNGATHSRYRGVGTNDGVKTDRGIKHFVIDEDSYGWITRNAKGRTWYDRDGKPGNPPPKAAAIVDTQIGLALLAFR